MFGAIAGGAGHKEVDETEGKGKLQGLGMATKG